MYMYTWMYMYMYMYVYISSIKHAKLYYEYKMHK